MRQLLHIAIFAVVLIVVIRLAVCFPRSLLARILFLPHGPEPARGESRATYLFRCARFHASWFIQAAALFVAGWAGVYWDASLADSLFYIVLWAVVIPLLAVGELLAALFALSRAMWVRRSRAVAHSEHAVQA